MSTGNETGANNQWLPTGKTSGGVNEAVVDFNKNTLSMPINLQGK
ncbi:hypothetical protein [Cricetibacter osteomyelitidis]|nr:hypothetical protein [Cricetibacter osteomyelitidis]